MLLQQVVYLAMQSASLCLTCTPAEELAVALRTLLRPLAILRVPVNEIGEFQCIS